MNLATEDEVRLSQSLKQFSKQLTRLALLDNTIGLLNELDMIIQMILVKQSKTPDPRRREVRAFEKPSMRGGYKRESITKMDKIICERMGVDSLDRVANVLGASGEKADNFRLELAKRILQDYRQGVNYVNRFVQVIKGIAHRLGINENKNILSIQKIKQRLLEAESDDLDKDEMKKDKKSKSTNDNDFGEILYHLDVATRHLDVLVDFDLIHGHESDIVKISAGIQKLAQVIRTELESVRVPFDERNPTPE